MAGASPLCQGEKGIGWLQPSGLEPGLGYAGWTSDHSRELLAADGEARYPVPGRAWVAGRRSYREQSYRGRTTSRLSGRATFLT
jgi:hypothetical protein